MQHFDVFTVHVLQMFSVSLCCHFAQFKRPWVISVSCSCFPPLAAVCICVLQPCLCYTLFWFFASNCACLASFCGCFYMFCHSFASLIDLCATLWLFLQLIVFFKCLFCCFACTCTGFVSLFGLFFLLWSFCSFWLPYFPRNKVLWESLSPKLVDMLCDLFRVQSQVWSPTDPVPDDMTLSKTLTHFSLACCGFWPP